LAADAKYLHEAEGILTDIQAEAGQ